MNQAINGQLLAPTLYVHHPDGSHSEASPLQVALKMVEMVGCASKVLASPNHVTTRVDDEGVAVQFPKDMPGRALVVMDSGIGFYMGGWLVSNNSLAPIPQELARQLAALRSWPAGSLSGQSQSR